jgi:hypothetical protein
MFPSPGSSVMFGSNQQSKRRFSGQRPLPGNHSTLRIMNELKEKLAALGLNTEMTDNVIRTVADFVKSKIPASYHGMIDDVLAGKSPDLGSLGGILGSLFGGR